MVAELGAMGPTEIVMGDFSGDTTGTTGTAGDALINSIASEVTKEASVEVVGVGIWMLALSGFLMLYLDLAMLQQTQPALIYSHV